MPKTDSTASVSFCLFQNFQNCVENVCGGINRSNRNFCDLQFCREIRHVHAMYRKVAFLETSRSFLLAGVADLQCTVYNSTKNKLLTKFLKGALKFTENFKEVISNGVLIRKLQTCKLQLSALRVFETLYFRVRFFRSRR